jgi:hypothetical protein
VKISYLPNHNFDISTSACHTWQRKEYGNRTSVGNPCKLGDVAA